MTPSSPPNPPYLSHPRRAVRHVAWALAFSSLALLLALVVYAPSALAAPSRPLHPRDNAGIITGQVVNGSHGSAPAAAVALTLHSAARGGNTIAGSSLSDGSGHFTFSGLDSSGATIYTVSAQFQGGVFTSPNVSFAAGPTQQITLSVYDVTTSDAALHIGIVNVLISKLTPTDQRRGYIPVAILLTVVNTGASAYVGSLTTANAGPMNLLRFSLPTGATNLALGVGFTGVQVVNVGTGFGAQATVAPGNTSFAYAFDAIYTGSSYDFAYKAEYPTDRVAVLVAPDLHTAARDFTADPSINASGVSYQALHADHLAHDRVIQFGLRDLPLPGENPTLDVHQLEWLAFALALGLALLLGLYLRRGSLAFGAAIPRRLPSAFQQARAIAQQHEAERKRLLRELLALEGRRTAAHLSDADYTAQRERLRATLRALLATTATSSAPTTSTTSTASAASAAPVVAEPTEEATRL